MNKVSLDPRYFFVVGKGGVGKTTVARLWAKKAQAQLVIWDELDLIRLSSEYLDLKLGRSLVTRFFTHRLKKPTSPFQTLIQAAPGFRDLIRLGKIWFDGKSQTQVIDMPATGHAIIALQALFNYGKVLGVTPFGQDAKEMLSDFNSAQTEFILVCTPEPSAFDEIQDLESWIHQRYPQATIRVVLNKQLPPPIPHPRNELETRISQRSKSEQITALDLETHCKRREIPLDHHPWTLVR